MHVHAIPTYRLYDVGVMINDGIPTYRVYQLYDVGVMINDHITSGEKGAEYS